MKTLLQRADVEYKFDRPPEGVMTFVRKFVLRCYFKMFAAAEE
jgi:hypothetical protein